MEARFIIFCGKTYKIWFGPDFFSPLIVIIPIIIIGAEHFLIVVIVTYMHSKSGDSYVLSLTFNLLESFSKIFPNFFLSFSK